MPDVPFRRVAAPLAGFVVSGCVFSVAGLLPSLTIELDVSDAEAAQLVTVFGLACALALPFVGRLDNRRLTRLGLVALAMGNGLSVIVDKFVLMLAVRIVLGVGAACVVRAGGLSDGVCAAGRSSRHRGGRRATRRVDGHDRSTPDR